MSTESDGFSLSESQCVSIWWTVFWLRLVVANPFLAHLSISLTKMCFSVNITHCSVHFTSEPLKIWWRISVQPWNTQFDFLPFSNNPQKYFCLIKIIHILNLFRKLHLWKEILQKSIYIFFKKKFPLYLEWHSFMHLIKFTLYWIKLVHNLF